MIDKNAARVIAQKILDDDSLGSEIVKISEKDCCFIVYYETRAILEKNDPRYTYGRYPMVINKFDGSNQRMILKGIAPFFTEDKFI